MTDEQRIELLKMGLGQIPIEAEYKGEEWGLKKLLGVLESDVPVLLDGGVVAPGSEYG